jgi:hypothetical protein
MESQMNKIVCTLVTASVLVSGAAYGQSKPKTNHEKQPLRDSQMDKVTAAGEENSAIAANNSTVRRQRGQHCEFV